MAVLCYCSVCCVVSVKSFRKWVESRKVDDKVQLISDDEDDISGEDEEERERNVKQNGGVDPAVAVAALANGIEDGKAEPQK